MNMRRSTLLIAAAIALTGLAGLAHAADPVSALKGHDSSAPIDVSADRIEVQDRSDRAIFAGNVRVKQATLALDTERLTVSYSSGSGIQIRRLDAAGGVVIRSPSETARGNFAIYDLDRKLITMIGAVQLDRGASRVMGSRLVIDLESGRAVIDGGAPGVGQSGGRVTGHFTVPKKTR
ncbi:MAG: LptA/OstA family protein [Sphingomicrobium sp.]